MWTPARASCACRIPRPGPRSYPSARRCWTFWRTFPDRRHPLCDHREDEGPVSDRHPETMAATARKGRAGYAAHPRPAPFLCIRRAPAWRGPDHDRAVIGPYAGADHRAVCPPQNNSYSKIRQSNCQRHFKIIEQKNSTTLMNKKTIQ